MTRGKRQVDRNGRRIRHSRTVVSCCSLLISYSLEKGHEIGSKGPAIDDSRAGEKGEWGNATQQRGALGLEGDNGMGRVEGGSSCSRLTDVIFTALKAYCTQHSGFFLFDFLGFDPGNKEPRPRRLDLKDALVVWPTPRCFAFICKSTDDDGSWQSNVRTGRRVRSCVGWGGGEGGAVEGQVAEVKVVLIGFSGRTGEAPARGQRGPALLAD